MVWDFTILSKYSKKILKWLGFGLLFIIIIYFVGFSYYNSSSYTNFCDLRGSNQRWISQTTDITDNTYSLGGIGNIGIGSHKIEIVNALRRRDILAMIFCDFLPRSGYVFLEEPRYLPGSTLGFYRVRTWNAIEFLFDENDRVTKIRITPMF